MTLILSTINSDQAIQLSDRRATNSDGTWIDNLNKSFVVVCEDARLVVGFTGLARFGDFLTNRWLGEALMKSFKPDYKIEPTLHRFTDAISLKFQELSTHVDDITRRLSVVFTGYKYEGDSPRSYVWLISNFDALDEDEPSDLASNSFNLSSCREIKPNTQKHALVLPNGMDASISDDQLAELTKITQADTCANIETACLELLRNAATSPESGNSISQECSSVIIPSNPEEGTIFNYYSKNSGDSIFTPGLLVARKKEGIYFIAESEIGRA